MSLQIQSLAETTPYDGTQLTPHWIRRHTGLEGSALVSFEGPASVPTENMVDIDDALGNKPIYSPHMVHFLAEWFIDSLDEGILRQHLFTAEAYGLLWERVGHALTKRGNDIFFQGRKLSVSIATRSGVSVLMHTAFNVRTEGTPVPTSGLGELGICPKDFAAALLERYQLQTGIWERARAKVTPRF